MPFYSPWQQDHIHIYIDREMKYIHYLKSRLGLNGKVEHLSQLAWLDQINESLAGTDKLFSLAKYSAVNVFSVEAGSNYLMTLKKYTYELCESWVWTWSAVCSYSCVIHDSTWRRKKKCYIYLTIISNWVQYINWTPTFTLTTKIIFFKKHRNLPL